MTINEAREEILRLLSYAKCEIEAASGNFLSVKTDVFYFDEDAKDYPEFNEKVDTVCGNLAVFHPDESREPIEYAVCLNIVGGEVASDGENAEQIACFTENTDYFAEAIKGKSEDEMTLVFDEQIKNADEELLRELDELNVFMRRYKRIGVIGIGVLTALLLLLILLSKLL
jgi:hypothetical protein